MKREKAARSGAGIRAARLAGHPASRNIEHPLKKILLYRRCNQFTDELANTHIS